MTYEPAKNGQIDGSTYQYYNCVPATCVMGADRASVGGVRPSTVSIRMASSDRSGGMTFSDAVAATKKVCGIVGEPRYGLSRTDLRTLVAGGHAVTLEINCAVTVTTPQRTNNYVGLHGVFVNNYYPADDTFRIEDPGTTSVGYLYWPASLVYKAAEAARPGQGINVIVWPDTEGVTRYGATAGKVRAAASVSAPIKASIVIGKAYSVVSTMNAGPWHTVDGRLADGWWKVKYGTGFAYTVGERLR